MFRINNKKTDNIDFYNRKRGRGLNQLKKKLTKQNILRTVIVIVIVIVGYGIWTHGTFRLDRMSEEELIAAQASNPLPPEWQELYFGEKVCTRDSFCGPDADPDRDGLGNYEEFLFYTDPTNPDTDGDDSTDGEEVRKLTNPIGVGAALNPRDVSSIYEYNPISDEIVNDALKEIREGNLMTVGQIQLAASRLEVLPEFNEIPFSITESNNQAAVDQYVEDFTKLSQDYHSKKISQLAPVIGETQDINKLNEFVEAVSLFATTLVYIDVPSDVFSFHKSFYGSLIFQALSANVQKDLVLGNIDEIEAKDRLNSYTIYYTRFLQDMSTAADSLKQKYDFPLIFNEQGQQVNNTNQ